MVYYFSLSTTVDPLKGGPGQISPMLSFLMLPCRDPQVIFEIKYLMLNLTKTVSLDGLNVPHHSLIGLDVTKTSHTMKCKEKIGLKLKLRNCGKTEVFLI